MEYETASSSAGGWTAASTAAAGSTASGRVVYCRAPGLLAQTAREAQTALSAPMAASPLAVAAGLTVRDACPVARQCNVAAGQPVTQARRLCPYLLVVPREELDQDALERAARDLLLDPLAALSPTVEPDGPDAVYVDLAGCPEADLRAGLARLAAHLERFTGQAPLIGRGPGRVAARALAECGLPPGRLSDADAARWLWPEDPAVGARLARLGLDTFGRAAAAGEAALVYQFGPRLGRLLYRRAARGEDYAPIRPLYPPPAPRVRLDLSEGPVTDEERLLACLVRLSDALSDRLRACRSHARLLSLAVGYEGGYEGYYGGYEGGRVQTVDEPLAAPGQGAADLLAAARRALRRLPPAPGPVVRLALTAGALEIPRARTAALYEEDARIRDRREVEAALEAAEALVTARHGGRRPSAPPLLRRFSALPVAARDRRRRAREEALAAAADRAAGILVDPPTKKPQQKQRRAA